jgi:dipeptidyl aminopeptidase/acylaminoacyl peptidase
LDLETHIIEVHVMNVNGTGDTALTNTGGINENASWSPDGKEIVFQSDRDGNFEVYKMAADGSNPRRLTNHPIWDGWPSWGRMCILGDADSNGTIDISDVMYLINYLFRGGPEPEPWIAGDSNNDGRVSVSDVIYLINYLFKGGPKPGC